MSRRPSALVVTLVLGGLAGLATAQDSGTPAEAAPEAATPGEAKPGEEPPPAGEVAGEASAEEAPAEEAPAEEAPNEADVAPIDSETAAEEPGKRKRSAGYQDRGASSSPRRPGRRVESDDEPGDGIVVLEGLDTALEAWYGLKETLEQEAGIQLGFSYVALYQSATATLPGAEDKAASHILRGNLTWNAFRETSHPGFLNLGFEVPQPLGTDLTPSELGPAVGGSVATAGTFGDVDGFVTNVYWRQHLFDDRIQLAIGRIDPGAFWGAHPFTNDATDLLNNNAGFSGAIAYPGIGFGAAAAVVPMDHLYVAAGVHDANAVNTLTGVETFGRGEFFFAGQVGFIPSYEERHEKQVHLLGWYSDRRDQDGVPESFGLQAVAYWTFAEIFQPFAQVGYTEGGAAAFGTNAAAGIGIKTREKDQFAVAFGYAKPSDYSLNSSFHAEAYWRLHLLPHVALTPSVQLLIDPPNNPDKEAIGVFGWRFRIDL
jgi:hypothetical protein